MNPSPPPPPYPPQYPQQPPGPPYPGPSPQQPKPPIPVDLDTVRTLWQCAAVVGMISLCCGLIGMDRAAMARKLLDEFNRKYPAAQITLGEANTYVWVELGLAALVGAGLWALALFFVRRMRQGRNWARLLLTLVGMFQVVTGIVTLLGVGALHGKLELVSGGLGILQAVVAGGAIYLMHRPDVNKYFQSELFRR